MNFSDFNGVKSHIADRDDWQSGLACTAQAISASWINSCLNLNILSKKGWGKFRLYLNTFRDGKSCLSVLSFFFFLNHQLLLLALLYSGSKFLPSFCFQFYPFVYKIYKCLYQNVRLPGYGEEIGSTSTVSLWTLASLLASHFDKPQPLCS